MQKVTFAAVRADFDAVAAKVADGPVVIRRKRHEDLVLVSKSEWNGTLETLHLMSSPRNAERLLQAIAEMNEGKFAFTVDAHETVEEAIRARAKLEN